LRKEGYTTKHHFSAEEETILKVFAGYVMKTFGQTAI
jgi:hypothetical protein